MGRTVRAGSRTCAGTSHHRSALVGQWRNQGEPAFGVVSLMQVHGTVRQHDLKRRPHVALQQMAGDRASTPTTQHAMDMQRRLLIWSNSHIAGKRGDFRLLIDRVALVALGLPVEIAENRRTEGTDGAELRRFDLLLLDEALQARHDFIPATQHDDERALLPRLIDQSRLHDMPDLRLR
jgi:hypothetical protein